ncbi:MAG TPA: glycosyltransferase family 1 protein [Saccharofermentans sp.]|nr:glycosyltransferase family 1 protein [Saccharofermentans sp.]HPJ81094.1 glycosyltransferase family 1 protein [Saccharofermentans sp.]HRV50879.1 glycosyltransferase family 1 protein [Saccharofermentans sp.]
MNSDTIALNLQPIAGENLTGIGQYALAISKELVAIDGQESFEGHIFDFLGRNKASDLVSKLLKINDMHIVTSMPLGAYIRAGNMAKICSYERLSRSNANVTVFFNYLVPQALKGKSIITIYDMVCERYPETMDDRNRRLLQNHLRQSANKADAIVTISDFSKKEIVEILGVPSSKVFVAKCGVDSNFYCPNDSENSRQEEKTKLQESYGIDKFFLYVGTLEPRKNLGVLIDAFEGVAKDYPDVKLVIAGGVGWHSEEMLSKIENSSFKNRIIRTGYVSDEMKRDLYRNCEALVLPSLYEGFGMPVVEAMACAAQCIVSSSSSLPEVSGGFAQEVDSQDVEGFSKAMARILVKDDKVLVSKEDLISNSKKFDWHTAAMVYKEAILFAK